MSNYFRLVTAVFALSFMLLLSNGVLADSMLTHQGDEKTDEVQSVPVDTLLSESLNTLQQNITTNDKFIEKTKKPVKKIKKTCSYPPINIRYKHYTGQQRSSSKYKHYSSRSGHYSSYLNITPIIVDEAKKNGISPLLLKAVISVESGYNCYAYGGGALGLCQLMPSTARGLGVRDPFNPYQNIAGGARYLGNLNKMYHGDTDRVLAAYNMGPGNVGRGVPYGARHYIRAVKSRMKW